MKDPAFVTFTGVDIHTDVDRLVALSQKYNVEWGVLVSDKWSSHPAALRYPDLDWIQCLYGKGLNLSLHLCNGFARFLVNGNAAEVAMLEGLVDLSQFQRVQVNYHIRSRQLQQALWNFHGDVIAQLFNVDTIQKLVEEPLTEEEMRRTHLLWDASGGAGILPGDWQAPRAPAFFPSIYGWAGGLGPQTIREELPRIWEVAQHPNVKAWYIDMESWVRNPDTDHFDLDACEKVLQAVEAFKGE